MSPPLVKKNEVMEYWTPTKTEPMYDVPLLKEQLKWIDEDRRALKELNSCLWAASEET